ncbi:Pycsar system effector family protein [Marinigracilibium pacificum]|uniref:Pycsar effector protein domain-containing protein n=1 Tax=Marinigracilibium pacificum TaxID=2729599 RepID=A0A848J1U2_9BACT|nr:Pycsar system effector family protein [Marinigracilibium pacificum]NMM48510.1 hypothetical protein [Marinigracilibium pacificum]
MQEDDNNIKFGEQDPNNYWLQLERLERLIRASELKAGVIFSFHSLILGLLVDRLDYLQGLFEESIIVLILGSAWILLVLVSIYYCFRCFMPRMVLNYKSNVFFFRDAIYAFGDVEKFSKHYIETCGDIKQLCLELSQQVHIESKIIDQKFASVQLSIKYFASSFIALILILIYWVVIL